MIQSDCSRTRSGDDRYRTCHGNKKRASENHIDQFKEKLPEMKLSECTLLMEHYFFLETDTFCSV